MLYTLVGLVLGFTLSFSYCKFIGVTTGRGTGFEPSSKNITIFFGTIIGTEFGYGISKLAADTYLNNYTFNV